MKAAIKLLACLALLLLSVSPAMAGVSLPEEFKDIPVFEGAELKNAMVIGQEAVVVHFEAQSAPEPILEFYKKEMTGLGWTKVVESNQAEGGVLAFERDGLGLNITVADEGEGKSAISMMRFVEGKK